MSKFTPLYQFTVSVEKEVDEVTTRVDNDKTITETIKVKKKVNLPVCLKRPSRVEREEADVERAVWETHFITKGVLPQVLLLKTYANYGGILSDDQKKDYHKKLADYDLADIELRRLLIQHPDDKTAIESAALLKVDLKQSILDFQQEQAVFFNNTAEAKARQKLIEWLVLHLSYQQIINSDESLGDWTPLFAGKTTEEKLVAFDQMVEDQHEIFAKARNMLEFLATVLASSDGSVSKEEVEAFAETLKEDGAL